LKVNVCAKREAILAQCGHILVTGGPGAGKTTIALLKAQQVIRKLRPGQEVLFLSFSRAAVRQILTRCESVLSRKERQMIEVQTYHSFSLDVLVSHGKLLRGLTPRFIYPDAERLQRADFTGDWDAECTRRASEESLFVFGQFAASAAVLFESCASVRELFGAKFPLIIVDEFQDTDNDQWKMIAALAANTVLFCLADPDQSIFQYDPNVDPLRLEKARKLLTPKVFDFEGENHRSPNAGILPFANAVLNNTALPPRSNDVQHHAYWHKAFESTVQAVTIWLFSELRAQGIEDPTVAVLCRSNALVARLSDALNETRVYAGQTLRPVEHQVIWDAELSSASAIVLASLLELCGEKSQVALARTMQALFAYYRLKNATAPTKKAKGYMEAYTKAAEAFMDGRTPNNNVARQLRILSDDLKMTGDPVGDWRSCLKLLHQMKGMEEVARQVRMVRLFRATDALGRGLADLWLSGANYRTASLLVKRVLDQERLISLEQDGRGCLLMNIHKSKGKEFDAVVLVEGAFDSLFFDYNKESKPYVQSRRLLRVGITRARTRVALVRFAKARPLVD
jgi:DNA helicase-2/ATP-dependent DNA helicase PcrA